MCILCQKDLKVRAVFQVIFFVIPTKLALKEN